MIFSIVTPSFNCKEYILENIESIRKQGFGPDQLEHWIIDGGSKDGTVELLKEQKDVKWISERDKGLSDAVNKGIQRATGDWIIWLNADDFMAPNACKIILDNVQKYPDIKIFAGDQSILRYDGTLEVIARGWDYNLEELLGSRTSINQASTIAHREVFEKVGLLDISIRYAMDYEWVVRAMHHYNCVHIPEVLTCYRRRKGSIMDANMPAHFEEFRRQRRKYGKSRLSPAEFRIAFYIHTEWLRKIRVARKSVRFVKKLFGREPIHPM